jgi:predicted RNA methylase
MTARDQIKDQSKGLKRDTIDKYYTKENVVNQCIDIIKSNIIMSDNDLIIEPSAGNGAFISSIKQLSNNYLFFDLDPEHKEIIKQDYLIYDHKILNNKYNNIHIIGNPPFGRQSSTAIKFIKKSCLFCNTISFILPKSFKKNSLKRYFPLNYHLLYEIDLSDSSFLVNDTPHNVPCVFQIWVKKIYDREYIKNIEPEGFIFVNKLNEPDISFRRVGVNAGKIDKNIINKSESTHYFIKFIRR